MYLLTFIEFNRDKGSLHEENLSLFTNKQLVIDADILLRIVGKKNSNPKKSLQEGHTALDMAI